MSVHARATRWRYLDDDHSRSVVEGHVEALVYPGVVSSVQAKIQKQLLAHWSIVVWTTQSAARGSGASMLVGPNSGQEDQTYPSSAGVMAKASWP